MWQSAVQVYFLVASGVAAVVSTRYVRDQRRPESFDYVVGLAIGIAAGAVWPLLLVGLAGVWLLERWAARRIARRVKYRLPHGVAAGTGAWTPGTLVMVEREELQAAPPAPPGGRGGGGA